MTVKAIAVAALKALISVGVSLLMQQGQKKQREPGLVTTHTTKGGTDPQATIVGVYATGGHAVYQNAHGSNHAFNTHVIEVGDIPGASLRNIIIDGEISEIGTEWSDDYGYQILSKTDDNGQGNAWIKFFDGTHTEADPKLVEIYGSDDERPWTYDHILDGICYAVITFRYNRHQFPNGRPDYRLVLDGPGFYDPRKDSSVGGDGLQRFADRGTWDQTANLMVIAYNILRGVRLPCGRIYGGDFDADDLPLPEWIAAFEACDLAIGENNRPQFRGGYEVKFEEVPADILKELFAACNAQIVEVGGYWYPLVGGSGDAVAEIDLENDLLISEAWQHDPFPGVESTFNAVSTSYPSPEALWNATTLETISNADWIAQDGGTKAFDLSLPMVSSAAQARQITNALLNENRRFRSHKWPMPPEFFRLRPLKTINATSPEHGYVSKSFRITEMAYDLLTLKTSVSVRETDPADFLPDTALELPEVAPVTGPILPVDAGVPGFAVFGTAFKDNAGNDRRPAIRIVWDPSLADSIEALAFHVKASGTDELATASVTDVEAGELVFEPVLSATDYLVQAMPIAKMRATNWTVWLPVTTPDIRIGVADLDTNVSATLGDAGALLAGYSGGTLAQALDDLRAESEASIAPLGGAVLRQPASQWTFSSAASRPELTKSPVSGSGVWITDDADFGECFGFTAANNKTIGPAFPTPFEPGRVYKVTATFKVANDGTDGAGCKVVLGCTTQVGATLDAVNKQNSAVAPFPKVADGTLEHSAYASTDTAALAAYGVTASEALIDLSAAAPGANKAYFHIRQNAGGNTNGRITLASIYVTDVTEAVKGVNVVRSELQAQIDGQSASIATLSATVVDLEGNASAGYLVKAQAGSEVSLLQLIAADGSAGSVSVAKISAADILLDGTTTAGHIDAESFHSIGAAVFGAGIESSLYKSSGGNQGWAINADGTAVFNEVIDRADLAENAASDGGSYWAKDANTYGHGVEIYRISLGHEPTPDSRFVISASVETRMLGSHQYISGTDKFGDPVYATNVAYTHVQLQHRTITGGVPSAWESLWISPWATVDTWAQQQFAVDRTYYDVDDVEWRLVAATNAPGLSSQYYQDNVRQIGLSARALMR